MGIFGSSNATTTQTNAPWAPAQPYIKSGMAKAQVLLNKKAGFKAPNFQTWVPMSSQTTGALNQMTGIAGQGNPLAGQSMGAISGILSGDTNQKYNDLYASADNPHWAGAVDTQSGKIADDVARMFSGSGRYGSDAMGGALTQQIGDFREQALANHWDQNIANQRGILGDQSQGQLAAVGAAPGAYQQQYLPAERMAQVGSAYDDLATRKLQSQVDKFNTNQQAGWNRLAAFNGALNGAGGQGGTQTSTVQQPSNWFGGALGGALGGGKLGGIPGAAAGGLLGLLSGLNL